MKAYFTGAFFFGLIIYLGASGGCATAEQVQGDVANGKKLYGQYCVLCHGDNGKMQLNGAKDITVSELTFELRLTLIKDGKNLMTPFDGILSESEIQDVAAYSMTLKP